VYALTVEALTSGGFKMSSPKHQEELLAAFKEVNWTDHKFADYCRSKGWRGTTKVCGHNTQFMSPTGNVIAFVIYRNSAPICRWIYVPAEAAI
jgi:hypothetical protein